MFSSTGPTAIAAAGKRLGRTLLLFMKSYGRRYT